MLPVLKVIKGYRWGRSTRGLVWSPWGGWQWRGGGLVDGGGGFRRGLVVGVGLLKLEVAAIYRGRRRLAL